MSARKFVGSRSVIVNGGVDLSKKPIWIEAPHIFKRNGVYYLICAEGGTADQHSEVVFRSNSVHGPYVPYSGNPILTQRHLDPARPFPIETAGHADFVEAPNGEWWAVFLATRNYGKDLWNTGRETFLVPVTWADGWPVMLTGKDVIPYVHAGPKLPRQATPALPHSGNFAVRDEFDGTALARHWILLRTPREKWYNVAGGAVTIQARAASLSGRDQPSFIARRQQHGTSTVSTMVRYAPGKPGDKAGLVAFHNETHYYFLGVVHDGTKPAIQLQRRASQTASADSVLASAPLEGTAGAPVYLRVRTRDGRIDFYYGTEPNAWKPLLLDADGTILSTKVAGGFVGTVFGMYAFAN